MSRSPAREGRSSTPASTARSSTHAYDVRRGMSGLHRIGAFLRHRAPPQTSSSHALRPDDHSHRRPQSLGAPGRASRTDLHRGSDAGGPHSGAQHAGEHRGPARARRAAISVGYGAVGFRGGGDPPIRRGGWALRLLQRPAIQWIRIRAPSCSRRAMAYEAVASRLVSSSNSHSIEPGMPPRGASAASARVAVFLPHCLSPMVCFVCSGITSRRETARPDISYSPIAIRCCVSASRSR